MFMRHRFLRFFFVGFFALMLIGGLRQARFQNAYSRGFQAGQYSAEQAAPPVDGPVNPDGPAVGPAERSPSPYNGYDRGHGFGPFRFLFTLLIFMFFFKVMRRMMWGGSGRHSSRHQWKKHWKSQYHGRGSQGDGPFNEFHQQDGRSAKERKYDESNDDGPIYEM